MMKSPIDVLTEAANALALGKSNDAYLIIKMEYPFEAKETFHRVYTTYK